MGQADRLQLPSCSKLCTLSGWSEPSPGQIGSQAETNIWFLLFWHKLLPLTGLISVPTFRAQCEHVCVQKGKQYPGVERRPLFEADLQVNDIWAQSVWWECCVLSLEKRGQLDDTILPNDVMPQMSSRFSLQIGRSAGTRTPLMRPLENWYYFKGYGKRLRFVVWMLKDCLQEDRTDL